MAIITHTITGLTNDVEHKIIIFPVNQGGTTRVNLMDK